MPRKKLAPEPVELETGQLNLRLSPELVTKLKAASDRFGHRGKNAVGAEIIETYFEHWQDGQEKLLEAKKAHFETLKSAA